MEYLSKELAKFSSQIKFAVDNYKVHGIDKESINNVIICGMGGSGVAGRIVKAYFQDKFDLPIEVVSNYMLPRYADAKTLVILCSYSGNTEEIISAYEHTLQKGCQRIVITGGGKLKQLAEKHDDIIYIVSQDNNQPRTALGSPLTYTFMIFFEFMGVSKSADLVKVYEKNIKII